MALSLNDRKKLVSMLEQKFPLAQEWKGNKDEFQSRFKDVGECMGILCIVLAGLSASSGLLYLTNLENLYVKILCGVLGCMLMLPSLAFAGLWFYGLFSTFSKFKTAKKPQKYRGKMRDYVRQTTCIRKVEILLPQLTDHDLNLLRIHPNFNPVFEDSFKKEARRRENLKTIEKINTEFLTDDIAVQSETLYQHNPAQNSPAKVHI